MQVWWWIGRYRNGVYFSYSLYWFVVNKVSGSEELFIQKSIDSRNQCTPQNMLGIFRNWKRKTITTLFPIFHLRIIEICLFATFGETRERKSVFFAIGLAEWLKLVAIKQTTIELDFLLLLSASERNAVFSRFRPSISAFLEWLFREQEHLKRENGNKMEKYLLLAHQKCIQMPYFHNEWCFQWDLECLVKSNQVKSNQIKSNHTFQYHMSHMTVNTITISLYFSEWRKI